MLILPRRIAQARPTIIFYFESNRAVLSTAATQKINAKYADKIAFEIDEKNIKLVFRHDGFFLSKKTGSETMLHINSAEVCQIVQEIYGNIKEKTVSFLVGTRENDVVDVITNSKKVLK